MNDAASTPTYEESRSRIERYFDRTASEAWTRLTSEAELGRIRRAVRAGRDRMRAAILDILPADLAGRRVLDAGCGTGALALALAARGAEVVAVDLSPRLLDVARARLPAALAPRVSFRPGDMLDAGAAAGRFDHVVAMDSLIHYAPRDAVAALGRLAARADRTVVATVVPRTPLLAALHAVGRLFPRADRAPLIVPVAPAAFRRRVADEPALRPFAPGRTARVSSGFYTSDAVELVRR